MLDRQEGYNLWMDAPPEKKLEKRWGMAFDSYLIGLEEQSTWVGRSGRDGYWDTPLGKMRTFGDLRAALKSALERTRQLS
jgi:hypothetical protein